MQIYHPLEPEDFALIAGKEIETREESLEFCQAFEGARKGSCLSESWPLYRAELQKPETIVNICSNSQFDDWQYERCLSGIFYVAMAQANLDIDWANSFCSELPTKFSAICYANSASRLIEVDSRNVQKALTLCERATEFGQDKACFDELVKFSNYTFLVDTPEFYELCERMPDSWKNQCLTKSPNRSILQ